MKAEEIKINQSFIHNHQVLTRVLFEGKPVVLYRCTMNIAAMDVDADRDVVFIPQNEIVYIPSSKQSKLI